MRYWSEISVVLRGPSPPPHRECCSQFTLSLFHELDIVLAYWLFRDLLGTFDPIRYRRSVGAFYCLQKLFVDVLENGRAFCS